MPILSTEKHCLTVSTVSQTWVHIRIIWGDLKNPSVQATSHTSLFRISRGGAQHQTLKKKKKNQKTSVDDSDVQPRLRASNMFWSSTSQSLKCIRITQGSSNVDSDQVVRVRPRLGGSRGSRLHASHQPVGFQLPFLCS